MLQIVNHIGATKGSQEKHLKFPINLVVRVDTGADVNCMNEKTFKKLFSKVKLSVCPHGIQNFGNSVADISILGQFCTYLQFRGERYLNTFIVTNANNCPNLFSHGATFRMGVLLPNYLEENVVKGCGQNVHLQVHLQMSSRSCKIYDRSSTKAKKSAIQIQCKLSQKHLILVQLVPVILIQLVH